MGPTATVRRRCRLGSVTPGRCGSPTGRARWPSWAVFRIPAASPPHPGPKGRQGGFLRGRTAVQGPRGRDSPCPRGRSAVQAPPTSRRRSAPAAARSADTAPNRVNALRRPPTAPAAALPAPPNGPLEYPHSGRDEEPTRARTASLVTDRCTFLCRALDVRSAQDVVSRRSGPMNRFKFAEPSRSRTDRPRRPIGSWTHSMHHSTHTHMSPDGQRPGRPHGHHTCGTTPWRGSGHEWRAHRGRASHRGEDPAR